MPFADGRRDEQEVHLWNSELHARSFGCYLAEYVIKDYSNST